MKPTAAHFEALFEPRAVVVAGAASHPGKFGFVAYHNLKAAGFAGALYGTNLSGEVVLGDPTFASIADLPGDATVDLVFSCVPGAATAAVLREAAARGARAAYLAGAGFAEAGAEGAAAQADLVDLADELGLLLVGPNGQGLVSPPASLCAQIVAPMPPRGVIGIASQSGGFLSSFSNYSRRCAIGISRGVSVGNCAQVAVIDFLEWFVDDPATDVALAYIEHVPDPDGLLARMAAVTSRMPVVVLSGGRTAVGRRAVGAHTGATPAPPGFDAALSAVGATVVATVQEAWEAAATFATQPLPAGPRTVVYSTAGGWAIQAAEAIERSDLELIDLPESLLAAVNEQVPPRWSRANPIDLAGSETRDTIPVLMAAVAECPDVDAVVYLGLGIQSNQAAMTAAGPFYPDHGLDRIVEFHRRQDARYATAAHECSVATGKPILTATELAMTDPDNPGPATVRATGRLCYVAADNAVTALEHLWRYARFRTSVG